MDIYYVNNNAQPNGDHEVHKSNCSHLPDIYNRVYLGTFSTCMEAVAVAKKTFPKANGCFYCSIACHAT